MNYQNNKKYFSVINWKIAAILIILGLIFIDAKPIVGIIIAAIGAVIIFYQISGKPSDADVDRIFQKEAEAVKEKGLKKLGLDEEEVKLIEPIIIQGPYYRNISSAYKYKLGKDNRWRSSNFETVVLFFSEQQVYSYSYRFSIIDDERNESTDEYFYKDIVSVATSSDNVTVIEKGQNKVINFEEFRLTTTGGTSISCSVWNLNSVDKSIQGMK